MVADPATNFSHVNLGRPRCPWITAFYKPARSRSRRIESGGLSLLCHCYNVHAPIDDKCGGHVDHYFGSSSSLRLVYAHCAGLAHTNQRAASVAGNRFLLCLGSCTRLWHSPVPWVPRNVSLEASRRHIRAIQVSYVHACSISVALLTSGCQKGVVSHASR